MRLFFIPFGRLLLVFFTLLLSSCAKPNEGRVIAIVGSEPVYSRVVDEVVESELYEHLYQIYSIRNRAAREYVAIMLIDRYSKSVGLSIDDCVKQFHRRHAAEVATYEEARALLVDSLTGAVGVQYVLREPVAPVVRIDSALRHSRGADNASVVVTEVSDYECGVCLASQSLYSSLFRSFGGVVRFEHTCFAPGASFAARAALAADEQGLFWSMHDTLMHINAPADSAMVLNLAESIGLDMERFVVDMSSSRTVRTIINNSAYLSRHGLSRTPMLLINGHPLLNPTDSAYVYSQISRAINEIR